MKKEIKLTKEDWTEIYYALNTKKRYIRRGDYDYVCKDRKRDKAWADHLAEIMDKIGPDGRNMY